MSEENVYIGKLIRGRRKALNLTQLDLSRKIGISRGSLANIELGRQSLSWQLLVGFMHALNITAIKRPLGLKNPLDEIER